MHPHTTTHPAGRDTRGRSILVALTLYPSGQLTLYGPMRSTTYSALHARAVALKHVSGRWSESVASELRRAADEGVIERTVLLRGRPAASKRAQDIQQHPGSADMFGAELERRRDAT